MEGNQQSRTTKARTMNNYYKEGICNDYNESIESNESTYKSMQSRDKSFY